MLNGLFRFASANIWQKFFSANIFAKKVEKILHTYKYNALGVLDSRSKMIPLYVMRRVFTILVALLFASALWGQEVVDEQGGRASGASAQVSELVFDTLVHDFGRIKEVDGPVSHTFVFTNPFDHPIAIERVYTSCGCTHTDYSRKAIKPGEQGTFTVEFDPEGREGKFDKQITIGYNNGAGRTHLRVKGRVEGRPRSVADYYPQSLGGGVRADANYRAFGNMAQGATRSMTIALINTLDHPVTVDYVWLEASGALEVDMPTDLGAGEVALATLTYSLTEGDRYGLLRDQIEPIIDGERCGHPIVATAIGIDNFELADKRAGRPKADIEPVYHDFGDARKGQWLTTELTVKNGGTAPLVVRSVLPREGTTIEGLAEGLTLAPGESVVAKITFVVPIEGYDTVFGGAMVVVNDPLRPVRELRVAANIKKSVPTND